MNKSKALKRFLYKECDFNFDFTQIHREWSLESLINAVDTGRPLHDTCMHLGLDIDQTERLVKEYVFRSIYEEQCTLSPRQVELMNQYHDHTVFKSSLGDILEQLVYLDPQAWLKHFENSILYLNDELDKSKRSVSASYLSEEEQAKVLGRLFGHHCLTFDNVEDHSSLDLHQIRQEWIKYAKKSGAAFHFFKKYLKQDQFLHPHPNDVLKNGKRTRILSQFTMFQQVLKDIAVQQDPLEDMRLYESELNVAYVNYTSAKIESTGLADSPHEKHKLEAIVKLTALFTLVKSPELRIHLFDHLVKGSGNMPFNFAAVQSNPSLHYEDIEDECMDYEDAKEGRAALYLTIIFIAEITLKAFVKDKLSEASMYFGHVTMDPSQIADSEDEEELLQLKRRLILVALLQKKGKNHVKHQFAAKPYTLNTEPLPSASDSTFLSVYRWVYDVNKAYRKGLLFSDAWKEYASLGRNRTMSSARNLVGRLDHFDQAFKQFARIKPADLGAVDIDRWLEGL
ncbi:hypothetical protein [Paenibacillus sp. JJ-223]|uniref:hypothetical protein n=1 Tax=Paenibacillus sp. JJ-223 TaxID=2905647 RepID=UPI001F16BFFC|nr:hypothetical protein [Paenibacillus sp. JJ-223]CAH1221733.1 hypothetical protein PAECIP111890_05274 [Paenibacillus sp. JJ-223]